MKLYDTQQAPNPRRARMFMAEKGIDLDSIEMVQLDLAAGDNLGDDYRRRNPMGTVPTLELDDGLCLGDSMAISRYFEELHPEPPLLGRDARDRVDGRQPGERLVDRELDPERRGRAERDELDVRLLEVPPRRQRAHERHGAAALRRHLHASCSAVKVQCHHCPFYATRQEVTAHQLRTHEFVDCPCCSARVQLSRWKEHAQNHKLELEQTLTSHSGVFHVTPGGAIVVALGL